MPSRRSLLTGAAAVGGALLWGGPAAQAHPRDRPQAAQVLDIVTGEDGFTAPARAFAGPVPFRLRTTSSRTGHVGVVRLRAGATEAQFRARLRRVFTTEGQDNIQAAHALMATAELYGGGITHPGTDICFTAPLPPGRYLVLEYLDFEGPRGRDPQSGQEHLRSLTVHPTKTEAARSSCATLTAVDIPGQGPRFLLDGHITPGGPLRYVNRMQNQVDEAMFCPITDDSVTERDIQAFFDGTGGAPPFDLSKWLGTPPLSPGREVLLTTPLAPGRYAAITWVSSIHDARPLSMHGQHRIVVVR
ncbi:hypothetical protein [Streptomyces sp. NPDC048057]|uniref:hypothetical protein n=1 Tax=Streptomyces sp. NPDC048057 TaxID=3155628 RepID=UPI0033C06C5A